jgi:hypothetical protein
MPLDHPELWEPVGETDASGDHAARDAIAEVARDREAGWYRARPAGDPEPPWTYCEVRLHPETGETLISCPDELPF